MEMNYDLNSYSKPCPKVDCRKKACECGLDYVFIPAALEDANPPKKGAYCNAVVEYEQSGRIYVYSREGVPVEVKAGDLSKALAEEIEARIEGDDALREDLAAEAGIRERADTALEQEIEDLKNNPDVVDIVDTYADLQAYDTSKLGDRDIVRVLTDETHDDESSYYRWDKPNNQWVFIGAVEGYYTKSQTDVLLLGKQNKLTAGANITIDPDTDEISATDTTYSNFVGTDGVDPGVAGLVPAPAVADAGKFLKADGTWDTSSGITELTSADYNDPVANPNKVAISLLQPGFYHNASGVRVAPVPNYGSDGTPSIWYVGEPYTSSPDVIGIYRVIDNGPDMTMYEVNKTSGTITSSRNVLTNISIKQTAGNSQDYVMSQNATSEMIYKDPTTKQRIRIGNNAAIGYTSGMAIGVGATHSDNANENIVIGNGAQTHDGDYCVVIGKNAGSSSQSNVGNGCVALGAYAPLPSSNGIIAVSTTNTNYGYNNTALRLIRGVHTPQTTSDAATKGYVDSIALGTDESVTIATSDWSSVSASPYDNQATVTLTQTITASSTIELVNDDAVAFATYGFAIASADTVNNTITIYSIGQPAASVTLTVNIK